MNQAELFKAVSKEISNTRAKISKAKKKELWKDTTFRERNEAVLDSLKGLKLKELNYNQLSSVYASVKKLSSEAGAQNFYYKQKRRAEGLKEYLEKSGSDFQYSFSRKGFTVKQKKEDGTVEEYVMSHQEISDFWATFRKLYEEGTVQNLRNYDKGMAGVSTVFSLYEKRGIKDLKELKELLKARYTLEKGEEMLRDQEAKKALAKGVKMLRE